jgi:hypothetical protein
MQVRNTSCRPSEGMDYRARFRPTWFVPSENVRIMAKYELPRCELSRGHCTCDQSRAICLTENKSRVITFASGMLSLRPFNLHNSSRLEFTTLCATSFCCTVSQLPQPAVGSGIPFFGPSRWLHVGSIRSQPRTSAQEAHQQRVPLRPSATRQRQQRGAYGWVLSVYQPAVSWCACRQVPASSIPRYFRWCTSEQARKKDVAPCHVCCSCDPMWGPKVVLHLKSLGFEQAQKLVPLCSRISITHWAKTSYLICCSSIV